MSRLWRQHIIVSSIGCMVCVVVAACRARDGGGHSMYTEVMRILDTEGERQRQEFIEELIKGFQLDEETGD